MATLIDCPSCNLRLQVPGELLGNRVKCPTCGKTFTAPGQVESAATSSPADVQLAVAYDRVKPSDGQIGFRCPFCKTDQPPVVKKKISVGGWIVFVAFILIPICIPLCWIGLLIKEEYRACSHCKLKLD